MGQRTQLNRNERKKKGTEGDKKKGAFSTRTKEVIVLSRSSFLESRTRDKFPGSCRIEIDQKNRGRNGQEKKAPQLWCTLN